MFKKELVIDYFKDYENVPEHIMPRELKVPCDSNFIISIIGPRRAGKTFFFFNLMSKLKPNVYLNFEDTRLLDVSYKEIRDLLRIFVEIYNKKIKYLFLDEIQNIKGWEKIVRELNDLHKYKIFLTGSSSKLLSREIATSLRGRTLSYQLLPFSFTEFLRFKKIKVGKYLGKDDEAKIKNLLREYLEFGGFPDVVQSDKKIYILKEYSDLILFRDFIERHKIRNLNVARMIHTFMLQNFSKEISVKKIFNKIKTSAKVAKDTVYDYVENLEDTMFFFFLKKFSKKVHIRESWPKKIYICDTGLAKVARFNEDMGKLMENVVFLQLLREKNKQPLQEIYYYKLPDAEVDFVVKETRIRQLIQVSYDINESKEREIRSLLKASEDLKCRNLLIITWDYEGEEKGIKFLPLWKWLLGRNMR